ncbi:hypothetical protein [Lacrimispora sp.]|uniref:hypothetical protein n=1 Tax=Lacrimispora sp. TaxID=2719234 RepID=UPI0028ABB181|nr:hypothetical protein [Lacrimispora sp.]
MEEFSINKQDELELDNLIERKRADFFSKKNNNHRCMYYNCNKNAINSHAISQKISLQFIAKKGKLGCFKSNRDIKLDNGKTFIYTESGIIEASSFKGFCCDHDKIFDALDNSSIKETEKDILYQVYRSICFSVYKTKFDKVQNELGYQFFKDNNYYTEIINIVKKDIESKLQSKEEMLSENVMESKLEELISKKINKQNEEHYILCEYKSVIENELLNNYSNSVKEKDTVEITCDKLCILYKHIGIQIPVAMLNHHFLGISNNKSILLFTVVPYGDSTELYWIFDKKLYHVLKNEWNKMTDKLINILNKIEGSMMQCDYWHIQPDIINLMPSQRLQYIKDDIYFNLERSPFDEYDLSIFDDLRKEFIEKEDDSIIDKELKKLDCNIQRKDFKERLKAHNQIVLKLQYNDGN